MATKYAGTNNGNWSTMTWLDGPTGSVTTAPGPADTVELNGKNVRIDTDVTVATITNALGGSTTTYYHTNDRIINANYINAAGYYCAYFDHNAGSVIVNGSLSETAATNTAYYTTGTGLLTINGTITAGAGINSYQVLSVENKSGPVTINGNLAGGSGSSRYAVSVTGSCPITVNGNVTAGSGYQCPALYINDSHSGTVIINGNLYGSSGNYAYACRVRGTSGAVTITGNVTGGSGSESRGLYCDNGNKPITITGNVTGGSGNSAAGFNSSSGRTVTINGNVTGGSGAYSYGFRAEHSGVVATINGNVTGGSYANSSFGVQHSSGTVTINGDVTPGIACAGIETYGALMTINGTVTGCNYGPGNTGVAQVWTVICDWATPLKVKNVVCGQYGHPPIKGPYWLLDDATNCQFKGRQSNGTQVTLTNPAASADYPTAANVRSGVSYAAGNLTGTCSVPAAGSVALGVPVDNTTGTAVLTQANVTTAIDDAIADAIALIAGSGPNQVNVTVSSSAGGTVQGVVVRMQATGLGDHTATTNSSGVARFNLPSGTWNLTAALNGYSYAGSTQVISTNPQIIPITMELNTVSAPSSPDMTVGVMLCLNSSDEPEENAVVYFRKIAGSGVDGYSHDSAVVKVLSNEFGIVEREFQKGSQYGVRRGSLTAVEEIFTAPSTQQFLILETIGKP